MTIGSTHALQQGCKQRCVSAKCLERCRACAVRHRDDSLLPLLLLPLPTLLQMLLQCTKQARTN